MEPIDPNENKNKKPISPPISSSSNIRRTRPQHRSPPPPPLPYIDPRFGSSSAPFMPQRPMFWYSYPPLAVPPAFMFPQSLPGAAAGASSSTSPYPVFPQMPQKSVEGSLNSGPSRKERDCIYFPSGGCTKGESCPFRHPKAAEAVGEQQGIPTAKTASTQEEKRENVLIRAPQEQENIPISAPQEQENVPMRAPQEQENIPRPRGQSPVDDQIIRCLPFQPNRVLTSEEEERIANEVLHGGGCGRQKTSKFLNGFFPEDDNSKQ